MEDRTKKIEKLNDLISKLEGDNSIFIKKPSSVKIAKLKLKALDPGYDIGDTLKSLNSGTKEDLIATFISQNYVKPFLVKLLSKF
ncbi:hypothetical protein [Arcobacter sp. CECT 8985]|uniref:hypothetical protein n=1 Tax=Arcobacter sp. CECT 8985 TaxID=1935424 RepID=UPI00100B5AD7|nr:hypothetical protein [Arcobacter sp. CECT 8985]RXJ83330.1 hypothetical protein CRU93_13920 [Arcobacter sp. CECT 8985]